MLYIFDDYNKNGHHSWTYPFNGNSDTGYRMAIHCKKNRFVLTELGYLRLRKWHIMTSISGGLKGGKGGANAPPFGG